MQKYIKDTRQILITNTAKEWKATTLEIVNDTRKVRNRVFECEKDCIKFVFKFFDKKEDD